ncbi:hypothetical protein PAXRUDRAFT_15337 [Paxillus rubicundulus Ve08.2h10]|uniref:Uncharacterized protein n=1 Tax=Paxillus rubicundulus Ve08.2h10 TaxID=930991 RepID=A0A0D0DB29_9AGAM|nr:hypothetical protein PAXRUDRAFT_15337 [Paxillus rubicundulus Ve08.2h10]
MPPSALSTLLAQSTPSAPKKLAEQVAFEAAMSCLHTLSLTLPRDADHLVEEWDMWSDEWNVAMDAMVEANASTLAKGLILQLPITIIPSIQEANNTFGHFVQDAIAIKEAANHLEAGVQAHAGSPMVEDLVLIKPVHLTSALSVLSQATTQSKVEVIMPKG